MLLVRLRILYAGKTYSVASVLDEQANKRTAKEGSVPLSSKRLKQYQS